MSNETFNAYRIMWLFVFFDMPTNTKLERKRAAKFRKSLLKLGFNMMQYSVYTRHCMSLEHAQSYIKKVKYHLEEKGDVTILMVTDKQYEKMEVFLDGTQYTFKVNESTQLELF